MDGKEVFKNILKNYWQVALDNHYEEEFAIWVSEHIDIDLLLEVYGEKRIADYIRLSEFLRNINEQALMDWVQSNVDLGEYGLRKDYADEII
jgi:hypothetical protein